MCHRSCLAHLRAGPSDLVALDPRWSRRRARAGTTANRRPHPRAGQLARRLCIAKRALRTTPMRPATRGTVPGPAVPRHPIGRIRPGAELRAEPVRRLHPRARSGIRQRARIYRRHPTRAPPQSSAGSMACTRGSTRRAGRRVAVPVPTIARGQGITHAQDRSVATRSHARTRSRWPMYRSAGPFADVIRTRLTAGRITRRGGGDVLLRVTVWPSLATETLAPSPIAMQASAAGTVIFAVTYHFGPTAGESMPQSRTSELRHRPFCQA
jgi:hypothetical protein